MKKQILAATAVAMSLAFAIPAFAGEWKQDATGWFYQYTDGSYAKSGWKEIDGKKFNFDGQGYMATGWKFLDNQWVYFMGDGSLGQGWLNDNGTWYYLNNDGTMKTSWFKEGNSNYYFYTEADVENGVENAATGKMAIGVVAFPDGSTYYFDNNGKQDEVIKSKTVEGIKRRYKDGIAQWQSVEDSSWIQFTTVADMTDEVMDQLNRMCIAKKKYKNVTEFETAAKKYLAGLIDNDEIEEFVGKTAKEYRDTYSSHYNWYYTYDSSNGDYDDSDY